MQPIAIIINVMNAILHLRENWSICAKLYLITCIWYAFPVFCSIYSVFFWGVGTTVKISSLYSLHSDTLIEFESEFLDFQLINFLILKGKNRFKKNVEMYATLLAGWSRLHSTVGTVNKRFGKRARKFATVLCKSKFH
jgi:hypothetical protein